MTIRPALLASALSITVVAAGALLAWASPASADPGYLPSPQSGAIVSHLDLTARQGYLNITLSAGPGDRIDGLTVAIPAAGGTWTPVASRTFAAAGLTCTSGAGPALAYSCHTAADATVPDGSYQLSLPAGRPTGPTTAIQGSIALLRIGVYEGDTDTTWPVDTFPVIDSALDHQSTAELRELDTHDDGTWFLSTGVLSLAVQIHAGDQITGVYIDLPQSVGTGWTVKDRVLPGNIDCGMDVDYPVDPANYVISCHDFGKAKEIWPAGSYVIDLHVATVNNYGGTGSVQLRQLGGSPYPVDSFPVVNHDGII